MNQTRSEDYREVEKLLLGKSHPPEKVQELLDQRYSATGSQKSYLILTTLQKTEEDVSKNQSSITRKHTISSKGGKKARRNPLINARAGLTAFIKKAQKEQDKTERFLRQSKVPVTNELLLQRHIPLYAQYEPLNQLWQDYISSLLYGTSSQSNPLSQAHLITLAGKLASADFHGALLSVDSAKNPSCVGMRGIVIWEAKTNFVMVVQSQPERSSVKEQIGGIRVVDKRGSIFSFSAQRPNSDDTADKDTFEIIGSRFLYRNADRSGRKFKAKAVDDL